MDISKKYIKWIEGERITAHTENIKIKGYYGTWYVIDYKKYKGQDLFLLESEQHGDEVPCLIITKTGHIKLDDVYNGFDELDY